MRKNLTGTVATIIVLVLLLGSFTYFYFALKKIDNRMNTVQTTIANNSMKLNGIVNFFNSTLKQQQQK